MVKPNTPKLVAVPKRAQPKAPAPPPAPAQAAPAQVPILNVPAEALNALPFKVALGVSATGTDWALQLTFTDTLILDSGIAPRTVSMVAMGWPLAKALRDILDQQLALHENREGHEIQLPKSFRDRRR